MRTYVKYLGENRGRFIRRDPHLWVKVKKWWIFWMPYGEQFYMHICNFTNLKGNIYFID
jgi:hypothetical protein